jgi:hypothetical protein
MTLLNGMHIIDYIGLFMLFLISVSFFLSFYWNLRYILIVKKDEHFGLRVYTTVLDFCITGAFAFILINTIMSRTYDLEFFDVIILRPLVFLLGTSVASNARYRYLFAKKQKEMIL